MTMDRNTNTKIDWARIRETARTNEPAPPHWPPGVRPLSMDGTSLLGVDGAGHLHWDGQPVVVKRTLDLTRGQRVVGSLVALATIVAAIATAVQAWAAVVALRLPGA